MTNNSDLSAIKSCRQKVVICQQVKLACKGKIKVICKEVKLADKK